MGFIWDFSFSICVHDYISIYCRIQMQCDRAMDIYRHTMHELGKTTLTHIQLVLIIVKLVRWEVETVFDIATELALFSASIFLVKGLQLSLSKKVTVIFAFGLRLA
jgi:hypothetical protein